MKKLIPIKSIKLRPRKQATKKEEKKSNNLNQSKPEIKQFKKETVKYESIITQRKVEKERKEKYKRKPLTLTTKGKKSKGFSVKPIKPTKPKKAKLKEKKKGAIPEKHFSPVPEPKKPKKLPQPKTKKSIPNINEMLDQQLFNYKLDIYNRTFIGMNWKQREKIKANIDTLFASLDRFMEDYGKEAVLDLLESGVGYQYAQGTFYDDAQTTAFIGKLEKQLRLNLGYADYDVVPTGE